MPWLRVLDVSNNNIQELPKEWGADTLLDRKSLAICYKLRFFP